jgi:hypothetical protein
MLVEKKDDKKIYALKSIRKVKIKKILKNLKKKKLKL